MLGFDLEHYELFFRRFVSLIQSRSAQEDFVSLAKVGLFFEKDAWFRKEKVKFWSKMNRVWNSVHLRNDPNFNSIHLSYKIIDLASGLNQIKNYCSLFFGFDRLSEYLTDPLIEALLEQEVLYVHKYRSMISLASQFHVLFLNEYSKGLWSALSPQQKLGFYAWRITNGFEFSPIKRWKGSTTLKQVELRNVLDFEFKSGMIPSDNITPAFKDFHSIPDILEKNNK